MLLNSLLQHHFEQSCQYFGACLQTLALQGAPGDDTLHGVRIRLRQLRSLIGPLHDDHAVAELDRMLAGLLKKTNVLRDDEVLINELAYKQYTALAAEYRQAASAQRQTLALPHTLELISQKLIGLSLRHWPEAWLQRRLQRHCRQQRRRLLTLVKRDKQGDRHRIRLAVKRLRYTLEIYTTTLQPAPRLQHELKDCQELLGNWHDRWLWLEKTGDDSRLLALAQDWQHELDHYHVAAGKRLRKLRQRLRRHKRQPRASKR